MTQLTINIEQPAIVPIIKKMLGLIDGVTIAKPARIAKPKAVEKTESQAVLSAFSQVKRIKEGTIKTRSVNDLLSEYGCARKYNA